jgi:L,D-transpeptidase ErfK/SrfK
MKIRTLFACSLLLFAMSCVRMFPEDIEALYSSVPVRTSDDKVMQPIKVSWLNNTLYIEAHPDMKGKEMTHDERYALALALIQKANNGKLPEFDQVALNQTLKDLNGIPVPLYALEGDLPVLDQAAFNQAFKDSRGTPAPLYQRLPPGEEEIPVTEKKLVKKSVAKSKKPVKAALAKSLKSGQVTASKTKKHESPTTKKIKNKELATASKSKNQVSANASKTKKHEPAKTNKGKKQKIAAVAKSKKQVSVTAGKTKKNELTINKNKKTKN